VEGAYNDGNSKSKAEDCELLEYSSLVFVDVFCVQSCASLLKSVGRGTAVDCLLETGGWWCSFSSSDRLLLVSSGLQAFGFVLSHTLMQPANHTPQSVQIEISILLLLRTNGLTFSSTVTRTFKPANYPFRGDRNKTEKKSQEIQLNSTTN
jgi:hypothetical protein